MPLKYRFLLFGLTFLFIAAVFFDYSLAVIDPDFGWHLQMGNIILQQHHLPLLDQFSYSMPSFHYVDHEWLSQVSIALLFNSLGYVGLAVIFTLIMLLTIILMIPRKLGPWSLYAILLASPIVLSFGGIRVQIVSWLLFALVYQIIQSLEHWRRFRWWLPLIFLFWANLHGSFPIGLVAVLLTIAVYTWQQKRLDRSDVLVFFSSLCVTHINPYGFGMWQQSFTETYLLASLSYLKWGIQEWTPLWAYFTPTLAFYLLLSVILFLRYWRQTPLLQRLLYLGLLFAAISARRHLPFWLLVSIPIMTTDIKALFDSKPVKNLTPSNLKGLLAMLFIVAFSLFCYYSEFNIKQSLRMTEIAGYPYGAVQFMKIHPPKPQLFAPYNWAGYLIWKYPGQKNFIDGRMPTWIFDAPEGQSHWAYQEYNDFLLGQIDTAAFLEKYHINTVLWYRSSEKTNPMIQNIVKMGWTRLYGDPFSVIYEKPATPSAAIPASRP